MNLGLSLGSGGARGFAFVPILDRLQKEGVHFNMVAGTSVGALAAGIYALNGTLHPMLEEISKLSEMGLFFKLVDLRPPIKTLLKGSKIKKSFINNFFQDKTFEDTTIPLIIPATNLNQKKIVYLERGKIIDAVMASSSLPGFLPPYRLNEDKYIDGCFLDPLPIDILLKKGCDKVIAIDLMDIQQPLPSENYYNAILTVYSIAIKGMTQDFDKNKVFVIKPKFSKDFSKMAKIQDWKIYVGAGETEIVKEIGNIKKWLKHSF